MAAAKSSAGPRTRRLSFVLALFAMACAVPNALGQPVARSTTPPAPSEVGLDMFQKFMADPSQDVNALLAETQTAIEAAFANQ